MNERSTALILQYAKNNSAKNIPCAVCVAQTYDAMYLRLNARFRTKTIDSPSIRLALDSSIPVMGQIRHGTVQYANLAGATLGAVFSRSKAVEK
jgi:hypothetical protein